jgi:predicted AAA+ superfamily ATPase
VDFVLKKGNSYIAIEAKTTKRINREHLKGLKAITDLKGLKKKILIYPGDKIMRTGEQINIWPPAYFLKELKSGHLWNIQ